MSSRRIVVSGAALVLFLLATISIAAASFPLTTTAPAQERSAVQRGGTVTLQFQNASVKDVLKHVGALAGVQIAVADGYREGPVSVSLENVTVERALDVIAEASGNTYRMLADGSVLVMARGSQLANIPQATQAPLRDAGPGGPRPQEVELKKAIAAAPTSSITLYYELAKIQENRGAKAEAEATYLAGRQAFPQHYGIVGQLVAFYTRNNQFDKGVALLEEVAAADPSNATGHTLLATYYEEKVRKDQQLSPTERATYMQAGIAAADRALTFNPDYIDAMVYKNILLRHQAKYETDAARRAGLIAEADALRDRAMELNKTRGAMIARPAGVPPPPPPPPPTMGGVPPPPGAPIRVGGNIKPPAKVRDARPIYPEDAMRARVQGVVILETTIDASGLVMDAKVLRSIPMLDQAAIDAVMQWEFVPTQLNGAPVPVIMTVTVNFTLQ